MQYKRILVLVPIVALLGCGPSTPEAKVQERAGQDFNCAPGEIQAKPLDAPAMRKFQASGCGREAVYVNAGDTWVLDAPNR